MVKECSNCFTSSNLIVLDIILRTKNGDFNFKSTLCKSCYSKFAMDNDFLNVKIKFCYPSNLIIDARDLKLKEKEVKK